MPTVIGIFGIVCGLVFIFAKDALWKYYEYYHRAGGIVNYERTPEWEFGKTIAGIAMIILSLVSLSY